MKMPEGTCDKNINMAAQKMLNLFTFIIDFAFISIAIIINISCVRVHLNLLVVVCRKESPCKQFDKFH